MRTLFSAALFTLLLISSAAQGQTALPTSSPSKPVFVPRPFGPVPPPTQAPLKKMESEDERPVPPGWIIGGIVAAVLVIAAVLWGAKRAWRSSNLFDRVYRFPVNREAAIRFGGQKCGGHMATVRLQGGRNRAAISKAKDA